MRCCLALLVLVALLLLLSSLASSLPFPLLVRSVHWIGSVGFCALVLWVVHGPGSHGVPVVACRGVKLCRPSRPWCGDGAAIGLHPGFRVNNRGKAQGFSSDELGAVWSLWFLMILFFAVLNFFV